LGCLPQQTASGFDPPALPPGDVPLATSRFSISLATVIMLVLLRLNVGWHFFSEGVKHYADPQWTSEPVLRSAKGPLAPFFHSYLPDFHGFDELLHGPRTQSDSHAVQAWLDQVQSDWEGQRNQFAEHYQFGDEQQSLATELLHRVQAKLRDWGAANREALITHAHEWQRKESTRETPAAVVPFQKKRLAEKQASLASETSGWLAELKALERAYDADLDALLDDAQRALPRATHHVTSIDLVDDTMTYVILGIGLLLIVGLFTRLACLAGAAFLLSVVLMQPFWVSDALPTFNQYVEMFALLTLATTPVGRWAGLDFFVGNLIWGSTSKGKIDVSKS
jgi:uncharacterized membrane protein YphA (DoxX/SURF4 family)